MAAQPIDAGLELVVDDDVVVLGERGHLVARHLQPPLNRLLAVLAAAAQPLLEHLERRRQHEDADGLDAARPHLPRALHVDHQHHVAARRRASRSVSAAHGAVEVAEDVGPLQELARAAIIASNRCAGHEIIVHAVGFPGPRGARRVGARQREVRHQLHQPLDQRRLAGARRRRDDEQQPAPPDRSARSTAAHSTFWTCSRIFSSSALRR